MSYIKLYKNLILGLRPYVLCNLNSNSVYFQVYPIHLVVIFKKKRRSVFGLLSIYNFGRLFTLLSFNNVDGDWRAKIDAKYNKAPGVHENT